MSAVGILLYISKHKLWGMLMYLYIPRCFFGTDQMWGTHNTLEVYLQSVYIPRVIIPILATHHIERVRAAGLGVINVCQSDIVYTKIPSAKRSQALGSFNLGTATYRDSM